MINHPNPIHNSSVVPQISTNVVNVADGGGGNRSNLDLQLLQQENRWILHKGCLSISDQVLEAIRKEHEAAEAKKAQLALNARKKAKYITIPEGFDLLQQKKCKGMATGGALIDAFNVAQRDVADKDCARMFYASGLAFNLARSPYFRKYSLTLANSRLAGYIPPSYNRLRTTLLSQEKKHINRLLQPVKDTWKKRGVSLVSDGWSDRQRRSLINIMAASTGGAMFIKAIDASGNTKDAEYVANLFLQVIKDLGEANVVQIVTDNASNYKAAGLTIEAKYPHVFWTPCVVHSLNLALKSICEPREKTPYHGKANYIFNHYSNLKLLSVAETRFASSFIMAKRLREVKTSLEKMVMDASWKTYRADGNTLVETKAREVKKCIVDDTFWDQLDYLLSFTEPIIDMLRIADTDSPVLHLIYDMWDTMIENVKKGIFEHEGEDMEFGKSDFFNVVHQILESR
ncbi:uncharacterized protein LOC131328329 [Rhododendron vialii]|uniref:uncharacterized protein LOC131328329 n=1 Tax=Rhododendron vialii TaxID=182163 RepID=UPI00265DC45E|nr:uncharacterized protein LOC131328329 [Rhododendron vialii]